MPKDFFTEAQREAIVDAIRHAEDHTSGEIRVHIDAHCREEVMDRAADEFARLNMHKTDQRNGVLFYLALEDHKFAILGDAGINAVVPDHFWEDIKELMINHFKKGEITEGLVNGIKEAGQQLKVHFPVAHDDKNELSDDISFGKS